MINSFLEYLLHQRNFSEHTIVAYRNDLLEAQDFYKEQFELDSFLEVKNTMVRSFIVYLMEAGSAATTIRRKISAQKSFFKYLQIQNNVDVNPVKGVALPKKAKVLPTVVDAKSMDAMLDSFDFEDTLYGLRDKLILECFYYTGIRLSELINLKIKDVDCINGKIKVFGKRSKERVIPITDSFALKLKNFIQLSVEINHTSEYLLFFTNTGKKLYPKLVYTWVNSYLTANTGLVKRSPHVLRHTFATHMLNSGADLLAIKELLGHESLASTQVYTHNSIEKLKSVYKLAHPKA